MVGENLRRVTITKNKALVGALDPCLKNNEAVAFDGGEVQLMPLSLLLSFHGKELGVGCTSSEFLWFQDLFSIFSIGFNMKGFERRLCTLV